MWLIAIVIVYIFISLLFQWFFSKERISNHEKGNVLFVTAHPDDETMFFGPSIISLIHQKGGRENDCVHLLCLSNGNYYGDGQLRIAELTKACQMLKIKLDIIEDDLLQDNPKVVWSKSVICTYIKEYVSKYEIKTIVTFDNYGVSGHSNHINVFESILELNISHIKVYVLESISLWRKYLSVFELPISLIYQSIWKPEINLNVISFGEYFRLIKALRQHRSQMLWFRYLYSFTSRYMFINTLRSLNTEILT